MSEADNMKLTEKQAAILTAQSGFLHGTFSCFHEYAEKLLERPILTHEFANREIWDIIKRKSWSDFVAIQPDTEIREIY